MASRAGVILLALAVIVWLGLMERDTRLQGRGIAAAEQLRMEGSFAHAEADLRAARLLNPDTTPDLARAVLYQAAARPAAAATVLEGLLRREPENLTAWALLYAVSRERDPEAARRAMAARRRLDPLNASPRR